jgi:putative transcriptional regulator
MLREYPIHFTIDLSPSGMNRILEVLKIQGRSQRWLAKQIARSYVVTTNYCNNKNQPSIPILNKMADVLNVDVKDLLVSSKNRPRPN